MNKARNKFILLSELAIILLLATLLTVINILNFTMAAEDADMLTEHISRSYGLLNREDMPDGGAAGSSEEKTTQQPDRQPTQQPDQQSGANTAAAAVIQTGTNDKNASSNRKTMSKPFRLGNDRFENMGPDSVEMNSSLRYFTVSFEKKTGEAGVVAFRMSAVDEAQAIEWASSLSSGSTGWTNVIYRYRVYSEGGKTYVTVIDQGRELWPCYRILIISVVGGIVLILISFLLFHFIGKKMFRPLEEADRKQKQFITRLESEFKMPLTIINADTEMLVVQNGSNEQTDSINKQVKRMTRLVKELGSLSVFEENVHKSKMDLSDRVTALLENSRGEFEKKKIVFSYDVEPGILLTASDEDISGIMRELLSNSLRFSDSKASFRLHKQHDRIKLIQQNDTTLKSGNYDQIFDRFTILENEGHQSGSGLGLSHVKEMVRSYDGRLCANVKDGMMTIEIDL